MLKTLQRIINVKKNLTGRAVFEISLDKYAGGHFEFYNSCSIEIVENGCNKLKIASSER